MTYSIQDAFFNQSPEVNGFSGLFAHVDARGWLITIAVIVCAYALTHLIRWQFKRIKIAKTTTKWVELPVLGQLLFPLLLWFFARLASEYAELHEGNSVWFEFLAQMFGAFLWVRLFLYVVRRALPKGGVRKLIEQVAIVLIWLVMLLNYVGKLDVWRKHLSEMKLNIGKNSISLADVLALLMVVAVVWLVLKWLSNELDEWLVKKPNRYMSEVDLSSRVVLVRILKGMLTVAAVMFSLTAVGIDLTVLSVFGGALGVGIGLGLQKIASNYVSGFVMLFERSVRIGDLITTSDGHRGYVTQINARHTIIQGVDGSEVLMPNEALVTAPVVNWSLHNKSMWMSTSFAVHNEADIELLRTELLEQILAMPRVLSAPAPSVLLSKFTDKGIVIDVTWWIVDPENGRANMVSEVNLMIWRVCRDNHIDLFVG